MSRLDTPYGDAAFEAHMAVIADLKISFGREPSMWEVAQALALVFGDACGILGAGGASAAQLKTLNEVATTA